MSFVVGRFAARDESEVLELVLGLLGLLVFRLLREVIITVFNDRGNVRLQIHVHQVASFLVSVGLFEA